MIGGGTYDFLGIIAVEYCHVGFGVGVPVDGVEESRVVGVTDGVVASVIVDIEHSEGFSRSEHCEFGISGMMVMCVCMWLVASQKLLLIK